MYTNLGLVDKNLDITNLLNNYYKKKNHLISIGLTSKEEEYLNSLDELADLRHQQFREEN